MSEVTEKIETKTETVNIDIDEIFNGAPSAEGITLPESEPQKQNIFKQKESADMSFTEPDNLSKEVKEESVEEPVEEQPKEEANELLDNIDEEREEDFQSPVNRKSTSYIFQKLIEKDKIVPFDDNKSLDDYTAKDWEELIEANFEEVANKVRRETPKQFFESLPQELQIAARYVAEGGEDMKGLFQTLAAVEETRSLDIKNEKDQHVIISDYLQSTGYGTIEEIEEEIEIWKDLGKLEQQAAKFKPKLDKMQEKVVICLMYIIH